MELGPQALLANGDNGANGINRTNGANGANGSNGDNGTNGTNGANGANGANGVNGAKVRMGPRSQGVKERMRRRGGWGQGVNWVKG